MEWLWMLALGLMGTGLGLMALAAYGLALRWVFDGMDRWLTRRFG